MDKKDSDSENMKLQVKVSEKRSAWGYLGCAGVVSRGPPVVQGYGRQHGERHRFGGFEEFRKNNMIGMGRGCSNNVVKEVDGSLAMKDHVCSAKDFIVLCY